MKYFQRIPYWILLILLAPPLYGQNTRLSPLQLPRLGIQIDVPSQYQSMSYEKLKKILEDAQNRIDPKSRNEYANFMVNNPNAGFVTTGDEVQKGFFIQRIPARMEVSEEFLKEMTPYAVESFKTNGLNAQILNSGVGKAKFGGYLFMEIVAMADEEADDAFLRQVFVSLDKHDFTYQFMFLSPNYYYWLLTIQSTKLL